MLGYAVTPDRRPNRNQQNKPSANFGHDRLNPLLPKNLGRLKGEDEDGEEALAARWTNGWNGGRIHIDPFSVDPDDECADGPVSEQAFDPESEVTTRHHLWWHALNGEGLGSDPSGKPDHDDDDSGDVSET